MSNQNLLQLLTWLDKMEQQLDVLELRGADHPLAQGIAEAKKRIADLRSHPTDREKANKLAKLLDTIIAAEHPYT